MTDPRRDIPSVDRLLASEAFAGLVADTPRGLVLQAIHEVQATVRASIASGAGAPEGHADPRWYAARAVEMLERNARPSLRPVINATGVVLHTNLGRAPLADAARAAIERVAAGYSNLEYDLDRGERASRYDHCARLLKQITGAEAALVVNNNAAALVLALNTVADGREAIISRGELVEIGGSFRIPDIMAKSGARMVEVGSTNRTHARDYIDAFGEHTACVLKVHRSNFRVSGFTAEVAPAELAALAHERNAPLIHDLGSGLLIPSASLGLPFEPTPTEALRDGADVVTLSGDKLLGGPQAGIIVGTETLIARMRANPLCRALRVDKLTLAALEATVALYVEPSRALRDVPVLRMIAATIEDLDARAHRLAATLESVGLRATVVPGESSVGGGAFPDVALPTRCVRLEDLPIRTVDFDRRLRAGQPPVVARVLEDRVTFDVRTMLDGEESVLVATVVRALG